MRLSGKRKERKKKAPRCVTVGRHFGRFSHCLLLLFFLFFVPAIPRQFCLALSNSPAATGGFWQSLSGLLCLFYPSTLLVRRRRLSYSLATLLLIHSFPAPPSYEIILAASCPFSCLFVFFFFFFFFKGGGSSAATFGFMSDSCQPIAKVLHYTKWRAFQSAS